MYLKQNVASIENCLLVKTLIGIVSVVNLLNLRYMCLQLERLVVGNQMRTLE